MQAGHSREKGLVLHKFALVEALALFQHAASWRTGKQAFDLFATAVTSIS
jgi:hypothetical protein